MRAFRLLVLLTFLLSGCASASSADTGAGYVQGDGSMTAFPPAERVPAPKVAGTTLDGEQLALADLPGPVIVNFWASWCGPCAREAPHLAAIAREYADEGVHVLGVNVKDQPANARSFERDFDIPYPSLHDEAAAIAASFGGIGPAALPSTIILDAQHRVAARAFGAVTAAQLSTYLEGLLEERAVPSRDDAAGR